jgi:hypothetical protein
VGRREPWRAGDTRADCGKLGAFINQVRAQRSKQIDGALADELIADTMAIRAEIR